MTGKKKIIMISHCVQEASGSVSQHYGTDHETFLWVHPYERNVIRAIPEDQEDKITDKSLITLSRSTIRAVSFFFKSIYLTFVIFQACFHIYKNDK